MSVIALFLLSSLGIAMTVQAQDCSKPIGGPNMVLKDSDILLESFPDGTKVTFTCDIGYRVVGGSAIITCTDGSWSPVQLICEIHNCGSAGEVDNGFVDYPDGTEFGAQVGVTCRTGYKLVGKGQVTCGDKGWMGKLPSCEVTTCYPPTGLQIVTFSPIKEYYDFREIIAFSCPRDLIVNGSKLLVCSADGTFDPDPPTCTKVECQDPESLVRNAVWSSGSRPPYKHKATVTMQCKPQYQMIGSATMTCEINNEWSQLPVCQRIVPPIKPTTTPTKTTPTKTTTTTTSPPISKGPPSDGNDLPKKLGIAFGVLISLAVLIIGGFCFFGEPAFIKNIRGRRSGNTDKDAPRDGEDVALA